MPSTVSTGDLILDSGHDDLAVFVFRTTTTITIAPYANVVLQGGAKPDNIFWSAGTSVVMAAHSTAQGNFFADTAVTIAAGAVVHGRVFAMGTAIRMMANTTGMCILT